MAMCKVFDEDEVSTVKSDGLLRCGLVLESSEYISSDESDSEELYSQTRVRKGTVRVAWHPEGSVEVLEERKVGLVFVCRNTDSK
jgi:ubiquitin-conjugating enzyme E2 O